jgi:hypothetical protein
MRKPPVQFDTATAMAYVGQAVQLELIMDEDEPPYWCCMHIVGLVLTKDGVWDFPYFMTMSLPPDGRTPSEVPFNDILSIRVADQIEGRSHG